ARAVMYDDEMDLVVVVGDREFKPDVNTECRRAFVARYVPLGSKFGHPWTAPTDALLHSSATSIARCGEDRVIGGWVRDEAPGSMTRPLTRWLDAKGAGTKRVL